MIHTYKHRIQEEITLLENKKLYNQSEDDPSWNRLVTKILAGTPTQVTTPLIGVNVPSVVISPMICSTHMETPTKTVLLHCWR